MDNEQTHKGLNPCYSGICSVSLQEKPRSGDISRRS